MVNCSNVRSQLLVRDEKLEEGGEERRSTSYSSHYTGVNAGKWCPPGFPGVLHSSKQKE